MFPDHARRENRFERISYAVSDTEVAIQTQGGNLDADKVRIALEHALALWGVVAPVDFRPAGAGERGTPKATLEFLVRPYLQYFLYA